MNLLNIENAIYVKSDLSKKNASIKAIIDGFETIVPINPSNRHYAEIMRQVEAGTLTIQPPDEPPQEEPQA